MKPAVFEYHRSFDVAQTVALLAEYGDEAKLLAGGQSLIALMNFRMARPGHLVDVNRVGGLDYTRREGDGLRIGALTRHRTLELTRDPAVLDGFGILPDSAHWIGHYPIRTRGTFGGSIAHGDPTSEWCIIASLLDAEMTVVSSRGSRVIPVADWFHGFLTTALESDELLESVLLPQGRQHGAMSEFALRRGDFAIVAAAAAYDLNESGTMTNARIALGGVDAIPLRVPAAEAVLEGAEPGAEVFLEAGVVAAGEISPANDGHGSAGYRRRLAAVYTARALAQAVGQPDPVTSAALPMLREVTR